MYMGKNRRLANVKTRHETGLDYITQKLNIETPFGKKVLKPVVCHFGIFYVDLADDTDLDLWGLVELYF